jgi:protein-disulfide isomerase
LREKTVAKIWDNAVTWLKQKPWRIGAIVGGAAIVGAAAFFFFAESGSADASLTNKNFAIYKDDHTMGAKDAPIVMIEYGAPTCPHCAHFNIEILPQLKKKYIDTGKVRYVFRIFPISPADGAVEAAARCLPQDKYLPYIDMLYRNQSKWDPEYGVPGVRESLIGLSAPYGLTADAFDRCLANPDAQDSLNQLSQDGEMRYHITAVPTFVINGTVVESAEGTNWKKLSARLDALLKKH